MTTKVPRPIQRLAGALLLVAVTHVEAKAAEPFSLEALRKLPHVAAVEQSGPDKPSHRIIHIADWHYVEQAAFAADMRSQGAWSVGEEEISRRYLTFLSDVEAVQDQQFALLSRLAKDHKLKGVYVEGLAERDMSIFKAKVRALRKVERDLAELRKEKAELIALGEPDEETRGIVTAINELEQEHRRRLLQLGAAGRLLVTGELETALPLEDAAARAAANPVTKDGRIDLNQARNQAREDAQVRLLLAGESVSVIILGGGHDLADNVERLSGGRAQYIRVKLKAWQRATLAKE